MNKAFTEICQTGNFLIDGISGSTLQEIRKIVKSDGQLYGETDGRRYKLIPMDDEAETVMRNFSDYPDGENESIYECREINGHLVVLLYVFAIVRRIDLESETMHFYMDRLLKRELEQRSVILDGDEVKFMQDEFMINRSVLIVEYPGERAIKTFQMYGNRYVANVERERPGVYRVKRTAVYRVNNRVENLTQFYGNIKFVTFDEALRVKGNDIPQTSVRTNEIFRAWDEFVRFEEKIFHDEVRKLGFVKYKEFTFYGDELAFTFDIDIGSLPLFADKVKAAEREYDLVYSDAGANLDNIDDLINLRDSSRSVIRLGQALSESFEGKELRFQIPYIDFSIPESGYLILSDRSIKVESRRRQSVMRVIESKQNATSNMLMRLSAGEEDSQTGTDLEPVTSDVKKKMFGTSDVSIKENFRRAMYIALNTPDIALIQGPPGTGKTTLINGIVARLSSLSNKNYKILVSSEQHEALYNVVSKLAGRSVPPFITSEKYSSAGREENYAKMLDNVEQFQMKILNVCDSILSERPDGSGYSDRLTKVVFDIQSIKDSHYAKFVITEKMSDITDAVVKMGLWEEVKEYIGQIEAKLRVYDMSQEDEREGMDFIKRKFDAQRRDIQTFYDDDGLYQLKELQRLITRYGYIYLLMDERLLYAMEQGAKPEEFKQYLEYLAKIKEEIAPDYDEVELASHSFKELFDGLMNRVRVSTGKHKRDFYDIVEAFKYMLSDVSNIGDVIKKYTNVVGSTCAQADRSKDIVELTNNKYDYVIIDEAARANPLDLMIPVLLGIKVIMVGDHMQLPHYIETDYVRRFQNDREACRGFDETLLTKSLFQVLYDRLEKSWNEGKLKIQRHIRIQEQHRMHPVIGSFISKEFYEREQTDLDGATSVVGKIENGAGTVKNINDFGVYNGKNVVFLNLPITKGVEQKFSGVICRPCEAEKVIDVLKEIIRKDQTRSIRIGVMSFYKGQVECLNKILKDTFPEETLKKIECSTVDSYQGKEFDVAILSTTRSNVEPDIGKALGFIHYSASRINVALSRARKLLIVVGDAETMGRNEHFEHYIRYAKENGYYGE